MNIADLQATLRQFAADRDWQPFQTPKNLAMAMMVEAAELGEIFQWMTGEQSERAWRDAAIKQHIGEEIADVLFYLLQIADHTHTDLQRAVDAKLVINGRKYPPKRAVGALPPPAVVQSAPSPAGRTHVLLDYENVQPDAQALRALVPDIAEVWLFHGPHQKNPGRHLAGLPLTLVPISKTGKNALDFHLTFYVGFISSRHPDDKIVVVANDQGYEPMLMHARSMGFDVRLQTFSAAPRKTLSAAKKVAAQARPASKTAGAPPVAAAKPTHQPTNQPANQPANKPSKQPANKPAKQPALTLAPKPARKSARHAAPASAKAAKTAGPTKTAVATKKVAAKKVSANKVAAKTAAAKPAAARPAAKQAAPAKTSAKPAHKSTAETPAPTRARLLGGKPAAAPPPAVGGASAAVLQKLLANLRRTGEQRPATRAPLLRALLSWLGSGYSEAEAAAALQQLAAAGYLDVTPNGGVNYRL